MNEQFQLSENLIYHPIYATQFHNYILDTKIRKIYERNLIMICTKIYKHDDTIHTHKMEKNNFRRLRQVNKEIILDGTHGEGVRRRPSGHELAPKPG